MNVVTFAGVSPTIHPTAFIAGGVHLIGNVVIEADASVWFNCVLRGDINLVKIGQRSNVQDGSLLHVTNNYPAVVGNDVTIGHQAIVHGCTIEDCSLIGMGAIVLDGVIVRHHSLVAAGAVVKEGFEVPSGTLVAGIPARIVRNLSDEEEERIQQSAIHYVEYASHYKLGRGKGASI